MFDGGVTEAVRHGLLTGKLLRSLQDVVAPDVAREACRLRVERDDLAVRVEALERDATKLRRELDAARREAQRLRRELASRQEETNQDCLYRRVGLDPDAPDFLLIAARKAHRFDAHPDRASARLKEEAHRRFVAAEEAFSQIFKLRGMRA